MKIVLIGASGFVGSHLIELLKQDDFALLNVDKRSSAYHPEITVIGDVRRMDSFSDSLVGANVVVLLAAEHRDDVTPVSLYYDVNVGGMRNVLQVMSEQGIKRIVFLSSVAIYGLNKKNPSESHPADPFNHYGKSKWQAEQLLQEWYRVDPDRTVDIIRPTVIFGERNRGNVYNLLKQISGGRFLMVGKGDNKKSMAYVGNIVSLISYLIRKEDPGCQVYNYADKPDLSMTELTQTVSKVMEHHIPAIHIPYWLGLWGGYCLDVLARLLDKKLPISSVRVRKFCATTQFDASRIAEKGFIPPYSLEEGLSRTLKFEFHRSYSPNHNE